MVSIFPNLCLWRRSLCSNLGGIDYEKLYRATLNAKVRKTFIENDSMNRDLTLEANKKYRSICYLSLPFRNLSLIATRCCNSPTFLFNAVISSSFSVATFSLKEKNNTKPRAQHYYFREPYVKLRERKTKLLLTGFCP